MHEELEPARQGDAEVGTDRGFGFVFATACSVVTLLLLWTGSSAYWPWLWAAGAFALAALLVPRILHPLNFLWFKFGLLLHRVITPVVLGMMFFAVFVPIGLCMRLLRKRPLDLSFDSKTDTYWIFRRPPGPPPGSFNNQF